MNSTIKKYYEVNKLKNKKPESNAHRRCWKLLTFELVFEIIHAPGIILYYMYYLTTIE